MSRLFSYVDYDKISDDIYYIGGNGRFVLKMNVSLARKREDGGRSHFYHEYQYDSKYNDTGQVLSIRRSYDYYLTLESYEDKTGMNGILIRPQDMILLRAKLAEVWEWFNSGDIFAQKKDKIIIVKRPPAIIAGGFPEMKSIRFEPIVIDYETGQQALGVRVTLSNNIYSDVNIDKFSGLVYIINSFDMVASAQMMLAYMGRPDPGTNRFELDKNAAGFKEDEVPESTIKSRTLPNRNKRSFFDMVKGANERED